jgi:hypothetical protein
MINSPFKIIALSAVTALSLYATDAQATQAPKNKSAVVNTTQINKNAKDVYMLKLAIAKIITKIEKLEADSKKLDSFSLTAPASTPEETTAALKDILAVIGKDLKDENGQNLVDPEVQKMILQKIEIIKESVEDINALTNEVDSPEKIKQALAKDKFEKEFGQEVPDPNKAPTLKERVDENISVMKNELRKVKDKMLNKLDNLEENTTKELDKLKDETVIKAKEGEDGLMRLFPSKKENEIDNNKSADPMSSLIKNESKELIDRKVINDSMAKSFNNETDKNVSAQDKNWTNAKKVFPLLPDEESYDPKRTYGEDSSYQERDIVASYKNFDAIKKYIIVQKPYTHVFDKPVLVSWGSKIVDNVKANEVVEVDLFTLSGWLHVKGKGWIKGYFAEEVKI